MQFDIYSIFNAILFLISAILLILIAWKIGNK